jgi:hypothetical protein
MPEPSIPSPVQLASWLGCFAFLLMIVNSGMKLVDRFRGHPPVEQLDQQVKSGHLHTDRRLQALEAANQEAVDRRRAIYSKIDGAEKAIREEMRTSIGTFQNQIGHVREEVAGLKRDTANQNTHLAHIEAKVDRLIERGRER